MTAATKGVAEDYAAAAKGSEDGPEMIFFTAPSAGGPVGQVKSLCGLPATAVEAPTLLILDIPDNGGFYTKVPDSGVTKETITTFLDEYKAKSLERQQLKK